VQAALSLAETVEFFDAGQPESPHADAVALVSANANAATAKTEVIFLRMFVFKGVSFEAVRGLRFFVSFSYFSSFRCQLPDFLDL